MVAPTLPVKRLVVITLNATSTSGGLSPGGTNQSPSFPTGALKISGDALQIGGFYLKVAP